MWCNCKHTELIIGIVVIVFAIWPGLIGSATVGMWILIISGALLIVHALKCENCGACMPETKPRAKARKRKK